MIVLATDYAGCLSMLMRYPPTDAPDVEVLVNQAIYLRDHSTPEGGAHIIKNNALRKGKPFPVLIPSSKEPLKLEGLVQEGFVHVTKNVNKVLATVGEVKVGNRLRSLTRFFQLIDFCFRIHFRKMYFANKIKFVQNMISEPAQVL